MKSTKKKKKENLIINRKRIDLLFLFSSMKIDVKIEETSDDRKQRGVCKSF